MSSEAVTTSTESPCNKLPYEVLAKIFTHCLSRFPLKDVQPDTKIAPMVLCHVCSLWRTVALSTTTLWSHLHYRLPIRWGHNGYPFIAFEDAIFWKHAMEFLKWWKKNHGAIPPFLRIRDRPKSNKPRPGSDVVFSLQRYVYAENPVTEFLPEGRFLLDYLSSAQYLDIHLFYRHLTLQAVNSKTRIMCPNLHTLVTTYSTHIQDNDPEPSSMPSFMFSGRGTFGLIEEYELPFVPLQLPPTLRRLSLHSHDRGHQLGWIDDRTNWSTLTHLTLNITCTLSDWFSTIRAVPRLQWGSLYICLSDSDLINHTQPTSFSLPTLSNLFVRFGTLSNRYVESLLSTVFDNLEFPTLQELHLDSASGRTWWDSLTAVDIAAMLRRMPMITKFTLAGNSIHSIIRSRGNSFDTSELASPTTAVMPLSRHVPFLTHLQLHVLCPYNVDDVDILGEEFVREIFRSGPWLDLKSPASTIRAVAIVIDRAPMSGQTDRLLKASIVQHVKKNINRVAADVTFKVRLECDPGQLPVPDETLEMWGV